MTEYYKKEKDPVKNFKKKLLDDKVVTKKDIDEMEKEIQKAVEDSVEFAESSPEPELDVFLEEVSTL